MSVVAPLPTTASSVSLVASFDVIAALTKAVVAICVVSVPADAVGAEGVPVNVGLAFLANEVSTKMTRC